MNICPCFQLDLWRRGDFCVVFKAHLQCYLPSDWFIFSPRYPSRTGMLCLHPVDKINEWGGTGKSWSSQGCQVLCCSAGGGELCSYSQLRASSCSSVSCSVSPGPWQLSQLLTNLAQMWGNLSSLEVKLTRMISRLLQVRLAHRNGFPDMWSVWVGYKVSVVRATSCECIWCHWPCHYLAADSELGVGGAGLSVDLYLV